MQDWVDYNCTFDVSGLTPKAATRNKTWASKMAVTKFMWIKCLGDRRLLQGFNKYKKQIHFAAITSFKHLAK